MKKLMDYLNRWVDNIFTKETETEKNRKYFEKLSRTRIFAKILWDKNYKCFYPMICRQINREESITQLYNPSSLKSDMKVFASYDKEEFKKIVKHMLDRYRKSYVEEMLKALECNRLEKEINNMI